MKTKSVRRLAGLPDPAAGNAKLSGSARQQDIDSTRPPAVKDVSPVGTPTPSSSPPFGGRLAITPKDVQKALGLSSHTVYKHIEIGEIPAFKIGGVYRIDVQKFLAWLDGKGGSEPDLPSL